MGNYKENNIHNESLKINKNINKVRKTEVKTRPRAVPLDYTSQNIKKRFQNSKSGGIFTNPINPSKPAPEPNKQISHQEGVSVHICYEEVNTLKRRYTKGRQVNNDGVRTFVEKDNGCLEIIKFSDIIQMVEVHR